MAHSTWFQASTWPSGQPIAYLYFIIPLSGVLIALFTVEQIVNGMINGFEHYEPPPDDHGVRH